MVDDNEISLGNDIHMELLWFVFSSLLQTDLDKVRVEWNTHYIRLTRHETVPGRTDELFFLPKDSDLQNKANISQCTMLKKHTQEKKTY